MTELAHKMMAGISHPVKEKPSAPPPTLLPLMVESKPQPLMLIGASLIPCKRAENHLKFGLYGEMWAGWGGGSFPSRYICPLMIDKARVE